MKKLIFLLCLLSFNFSYGDEDTCIAITKDKLCMQLEWSKGPYVGAYSQNIVRFKNLKLSSANETVYTSPKESIQFLGWMIMASHEHGTRPVQTKLVKDGVYENTRIFYMGGMMGTWQFRVKIGNESFVLHSLDI